MERKLASVQRIVGLNPIQGADRIECAKVLGWECIVKKKEVKVGELAVYIEIDSIVPERPEFEFLRDRKFRIKTIKLRGQVSQGLVLPLSILPKGNYNEGDDVTEILGIRKYDPQAEAERKLYEQSMATSKNKVHKFFLRYPWYRRIFAFLKPQKDKFPNFISKTDETRIQNIPYIVETEKDTTFIETEKLDGQSGTYFLIKNPNRFPIFGKKYIFGVCSRNLHLPKPNKSSYWTIAKQYRIKEVLESLIGDEDFVVIQGEILGEGIQGNRYKVKGYDFYAFNLKYPNRKINSVEASEILREHGIKFVPILNTNFKLKETVGDLVEYSKGNSTLLPVTREGIVLRNYDKDISFKVISPDYLLETE